jgi:hypothetical protein
MAVWGIAFGIAATITGAFVLSALEGGFLAESFFLIVISWIVLLVLIAKLANWLRKK